MEGPPTYVMFPKKLWTPEMHKMKFPVVFLEKALYGHVENGYYWQEYCKKQCLKAGFKLYLGELAMRLLPSKTTSYC